MASATLRATFCNGGAGNHATVTATLGARSVSFDTIPEEMQEPITDEEFRAWAKVTLKIRRTERTAAQIKASLQGTGIAVSVTG